jgi:hypothetical protein
VSQTSSILFTTQNSVNGAFRLNENKETITENSEQILKTHPLSIKILQIKSSNREILLVKYTEK